MLTIRVAKKRGMDQAIKVCHFATAVAWLFATLSIVGAETTTPSKPNIVFILVDDLGWGDLGCYGNLDIATPNLDRLADEGMLFEQFYVNASLCSPSRAAMITGRFPATNGIHYWMAPTHNRRMGMPDALDPTLVNLPRTLQQAGYRTAHFGKWHLGEDKNLPVTAYGYDEADIVWQGIGPNPGVAPNAADGTAKLVDRTVAFGESCLVDGQPYFVSLWARDVHADLAPTKTALDRYKHFESRPGIATAMQIYYAAVTEMDLQIGRLMAWIDADPARAANTLLIFTSDNGPEDPYIPHAGHHAAGSTGPFRGRKRSLYEGGIRLPLIIRWKDRVPAGVVDQASVVSGVDLLPTLATLAQTHLPEGTQIDGEDFSETLLTARGHIRTQPLMWEWRFEGVGQLIHRSPMLAIREGDWKLLFNPDGSRVELYNIPQQPMELHSVAEDHPDIVARMSQLARHWQATLPDGPKTEQPGSLEYPGYHEAPGRGPLIDRKRYEKLLAPVRVRLMRELHQANSKESQTK
jgi:N-acetylgalactosamine-6-sulfatase